MTDKEKLLKLRKLADAMYYAAQHLTTDASRLHKAMDEYHQFIINEYHKKEHTIPDIVDEHFYEMLEEEPARKVWHDMDEVPQKKADIVYYRPDRNKIESRKGGMGSYTKCYTKWAYTNDLVGIEEIPLRLPMIPQENAIESLGISRGEYKTIVDERIYSKEEPVSEELEEAAYKFVMDNFRNPKEPLYKFDQRCFKAGAKWQKQKDNIPVSEGLEEAADEVLNSVLNTHEIVNVRSCLEMFKFGSKWKEQQFEKERLKHCDELTPQQAQIESDFVTQHLKENNRTPTFIDAIEYGKKMQKEQMMKDAIEAYIRRNKHTKKNVLNGLDVTCDAIQNFKDGDKIKIILIKED